MNLNRANGLLRVRIEDEDGNVWEATGDALVVIPDLSGVDVELNLTDVKHTPAPRTFRSGDIVRRDYECGDPIFMIRHDSGEWHDTDDGEYWGGDDSVRNALAGTGLLPSVFVGNLYDLEPRS